MSRSIPGVQRLPPLLDRTMTSTSFYLPSKRWSSFGLTIYATKGDFSQHQQSVKYMRIQQCRRAAANHSVSILIIDIAKFSLRASNRLAYDREISGPLSANTLLGLPEYYTVERYIY